MRKYLLQTWNDHRIEIRKSPISGGGMFAREAIKKDEPTCIAGGMVMTDSEKDIGIIFRLLSITESINVQAK
jgi:hypothetical protein